MNNLLVKCHTWGGLTPGGVQVTRALTREVNLDTQSSEISAEEVREVIPIPNSLGENCVDRYLYLLKMSEMPMSVDFCNNTTPILWDKVICAVGIYKVICGYFGSPNLDLCKAI